MLGAFLPSVPGRARDADHGIKTSPAGDRALPGSLVIAPREHPDPTHGSTPAAPGTTPCRTPTPHTASMATSSAFRAAVHWCCAPMTTGQWTCACGHAARMRRLPVISYLTHPVAMEHLLPTSSEPGCLPACDSTALLCRRIEPPGCGVRATVSARVGTRRVATAASAASHCSNAYNGGRRPEH